MFFVCFTVTVWTVEAQTWCQCEGANYPVNWDFSTFEEAQDFYQKFWTTELSSHPNHFGWCEERHTLLLGVKGDCGDLQSSCGEYQPEVFTFKHWVVPDYCQCGDCQQALALEEEFAASEEEVETDPGEYLEELLPVSYRD